MHKQEVTIYTKFGSRKSVFPIKNDDEDGVYIRPQNRLLWGRGSERPAAYTCTQQF